MPLRPRPPSGLPPQPPEGSITAGGLEIPAYVALDVETANSDYASICQVGIAEFRSDGALGRTWASLIDPEDDFAGMNVSIHGIDQDAVRGAPCFPDALAEIRAWCDNRIVVHHMPFDRVAIGRAADRYGLSAPRATWLDSAGVARRAWKRFARRGYGLRNLASEFRIPLRHHDALSDAIAAGTVMALAIEESGMDVSDWLHRVRQPLAGSPSPIRAGDPAGHLSGETIVFTGRLTMPRRQAADLAAAVGADVASTLTHRTTFLVVAGEAPQESGGRTRSSKHRKAEALIRQGARISIIGEREFLELVAPAE